MFVTASRRWQLAGSIAPNTLRRSIPNLQGQQLRRSSSFRPASVRQVQLPLAEDKASAILQSPEPCIFNPNASSTSSSTGHAFMSALRALDRLVPVEHGGYASPDLERVHLPLSAYLDWLDQGHATVQGKQLYLAQESSLWQDEPALQQALPVPALLQPLIQEKKADLYQAALFLGPSGASSALHYDPTANLFQIVSAPHEAKKAFLVFPPTLRDSLGASSSGRNTLSLPISMQVPDSSTLHCSVESSSMSQQQQEVIASQAQSALLGEGDMLYLPPRWWHMVQNTSRDHDSDDGRAPTGSSYVAGMGWWFHLRGQA